MIGSTQQQTYNILVISSLLAGMFLQSQIIQRNHLQLLAEILDACTEPQVKTQVMHETGISLRQFQYCLKQLMKQRMLEMHHRKKTYATTEKGKRYLQLWAGL